MEIEKFLSTVAIKPLTRLQESADFRSVSGHSQRLLRCTCFIPRETRPLLVYGLNFWCQVDQCLPAS